MKTFLLSAAVGALGNLAFLPSGSLESMVTEDTCTPAVVCQVSGSSQGTWSTMNETAKGGYCKCVEQDCLTKHCVIKVDVTCTTGPSHKVTGGGNCQASQLSGQISITSCGGVQQVGGWVYSGANCTGTSTWCYYKKECGQGNCGDYQCPQDG